MTTPETNHVIAGANKIIADYKAAYMAANGCNCPSVTYNRGWYRIDYGSFLCVTKYRRSDILKMTAELQRRVA